MKNDHKSYHRIVNSSISASDLADAVQAERKKDAANQARRIITALDNANDVRKQAERELKQAAKRLKKYNKALKKFGKSGKISDLNMFG